MTVRRRAGAMEIAPLVPTLSIVSEFSSFLSTALALLTHAGVGAGTKTGGAADAVVAGGGGGGGSGDRAPPFREGRRPGRGSADAAPAPVAVVAAVVAPALLACGSLDERLARAGGRRAVAGESAAGLGVVEAVELVVVVAGVCR